MAKGMNYSSQANCPPTGGATKNPANKAPSAAQKAEATGMRPTPRGKGG